MLKNYRISSPGILKKWCFTNNIKNFAFVYESVILSHTKTSPAVLLIAMHFMASDNFFIKVLQLLMYSLVRLGLLSSQPSSFLLHSHLPTKSQMTVSELCEQLSLLAALALSNTVNSFSFYHSVSGSTGGVWGEVNSFTGCVFRIGTYGTAPNWAW